MLPPREMSTRCLRCGLELPREATHCPSCGADRELELKVAAELVPTIGSLRRWLGGLGVLKLGFALLMYEHFGSRLDPVAFAMDVGSAVVFLGLAAAAHRIPFGAAVTATSLFAAEWILAIVVNPFAALAPGLGLGLRIVLSFVLVGAVRSGYRARRLRRQADDAVHVPMARTARGGQ